MEDLLSRFFTKKATIEHRESGCAQVHLADDVCLRVNLSDDLIGGAHAVHAPGLNMAEGTLMTGFSLMISKQSLNYGSEMLHQLRETLVGTVGVKMLPNFLCLFVGQRSGVTTLDDVLDGGFLMTAAEYGIVRSCYMFPFTMLDLDGRFHERNATIPYPLIDAVDKSVLPHLRVTQHFDSLDGLIHSVDGLRDLFLLNKPLPLDFSLHAGPFMREYGQLLECLNLRLQLPMTLKSHACFACGGNEV